MSFWVLFLVWQIISIALKLHHLKGYTYWDLLSHIFFLESHLVNEAKKKLQIRISFIALSTTFCVLNQNLSQNSYLFVHDFSVTYYPLLPSGFAL